MYSYEIHLIQMKNTKGKLWQGMWGEQLKNWGSKLYKSFASEKGYTFKKQFSKWRFFKNLEFSQSLNCPILFSIDQNWSSKKVNISIILFFLYNLIYIRVLSWGAFCPSIILSYLYFINIIYNRGASIYIPLKHLKIGKLWLWLKDCSSMA